jgi:uncharacterized repeat protein (TIGR03803 family)
VAGSFETLYSFTSPGGSSWAGLLQATNGTFYGTTIGATNDFGTVFSLSTGIGPFVETLPAAGSVGTGVTILGNGLTGATSMTFNGTAATFTVVSATEITTAVPTGATTGTVEVTTPSGIFYSNLPFQVP